MSVPAGTQSVHFAKAALPDFCAALGVWAARARVWLPRAFLPLTLTAARAWRRGKAFSKLSPVDSVTSAILAQKHKGASGLQELARPQGQG